MENYPFEYQAGRHDKDPGDLEVWQADGFDLQAAFNTIHGPIIEIGGPTVDGFKDLQGINMPDRPIVTNVSFETIRGREEFVEMLADGRNLPFKESSVGAMLASSITPYDERKYGWDYQKIFAVKDEHPDHPDLDQRPAILVESARLLEAGGILIWQGASEKDIESAAEAGLNLVKKTIRRAIGFYPSTGNSEELLDCWFVFQKPV